MQSCGHLTILCGPMWSSKSTELAAKISKYSDIGMRCLFINHFIDERSESKDTADDGHFSKHGSSSFHLSESIRKIKVSDLTKVDVGEYDAIAIDECQFFGEELVTEVRDWVNVHHKVVVCAGLDGDFECKRIGYLLDLIPHADKVKKLRARCTICIDILRNSELKNIDAIKAKAPFTAKIVKNSDGQICVGGSESYASLCRYHHHRHLTGKSLYEDHRRQDHWVDGDDWDQWNWQEKALEDFMSDKGRKILYLPD